MTTFTGSLSIKALDSDSTVASINQTGLALFKGGVYVSATAQMTALLLQGTKSVSNITVTALTSTQATAYNQSHHPFILLCLTVGGTTVGIPAFSAGTYGG